VRYCDSAYVTDSAYFDADSYDHMIPTAWIPLLDVNADNGTLQVIQLNLLFIL